MWCEQCYGCFFNDLCLTDLPTSLPPGPSPCGQTNLFNFTDPPHPPPHIQHLSFQWPPQHGHHHPTPWAPLACYWQKQPPNFSFHWHTFNPDSLFCATIKAIFLYNFFDRGSNSKLQEQYKNLVYILHRLRQLLACCPFTHTHSLSPTSTYTCAFFQNHLKVNCIHHGPLTKLFRVCFLWQRHYLM